MNKQVIITGGSKGIGLEIVKILIKNNYDVINISRTPCEVENVKNISCDVTNLLELQNTIDSIDKIDILIVNAGFGISGAIEFQKEEEIRKQFELNFFAATNITRLCIPKLKETKGRIIFTSSLASIFSIPFQSFYSATKAALEAYSLALNNELKMFNVTSTFVRLGDVKTSFTKNREKNIIGDDIYEGRISKSVHKMELDEEKGMNPERVAKGYLKIIKKKHPKAVYTIGFSNKLLTVLKHLLPLNLVNKIVRSIYVKK